MRIKTKFERWTAIAYNSLKNVTNSSAEFEQLLKNNHNKDVAKNAKDLAVRVKQLLSMKSNIPTPVGSVKNKSKKKVK